MPCLKWGRSKVELAENQQWPCFLHKVVALGPHLWDTLLRCLLIQNGLAVTNELAGF